MAETANTNDRGGYDYKFVDPPSDTLVCKICHYPSREPHLSGCCGHTFCKSCLEGAKKATAIAYTCPICRNEQFITMPNKQVDRAVKGLRVFCTNKKEGCEWQGEVNDINDHLKKITGCQFEEVTCPNKCGQTKERQLLTKHVEKECPFRKVNCQYCHTAAQYQFIEGEHKEQCPRFPIACPNKCEVGSVPRDHLEEHVKMCPLELIQCEYHMVGCEERMVRKDQENHNREKMEEHMSLTISHLPSIQQKVASIQVATMKDLDSKISQANDEVAVSKHQLSIIAKNIADAQQDTIKIISQTIKKQNKATWFYGSCVVSIVIVLLAIYIHSTQGRIAELETKLEQKTKQIKQLQLLTWNAELIYNASKFLSHPSDNRIAPVIVKMNEFSKKKKDGINWMSEPFYTHSKGYKLYLDVEANGYETVWGTHLSVFLFLKRGPYDDQLEWPLRIHGKIKLLNQISDSEHKIMTEHNTVNDKINSTHPVALLNAHFNFISFNELNKTTDTHQYVKDDSIFFEVDVTLH